MKTVKSKKIKYFLVDVNIFSIFQLKTRHLPVFLYALKKLWQKGLALPVSTLRTEITSPSYARFRTYPKCP